MNKFKVDLTKSRPSSPLLYGLFLEDINHSIDGGLNADLIQNGSFDFCQFDYGKTESKVIYDHMKFWSCAQPNQVSVTDKHSIHKNNPFSLALKLNNDIVELKNAGYEIYENENFIFLPSDSCKCYFYYKTNTNVEAEVFFEYSSGVSQSKKIKLSPCSKYQETKFNLQCQKNQFARIVFRFKGKGTIYLTGFRLIPDNYFKSKTNPYKYGKFNAKLVESLDIGAKFLRFPGGCLVEGDISTDYLYEWEKTIGPLYARCHKPSVWNYLQSNEIGFFEYFCLCEDLNLEPLPVHHVGLICQIRTEIFRHRGFIALTPSSKAFQEKVIDSVAHLIYFAKGSTLSKDKVEKTWALKRKEMRHPKPFKLNFIALGNENWDKIYFRNFSACYNALKKYKYCSHETDILKKFNIQILSTSGVDINPQDTNPSWRFITKNYNELIIDEHVYNTPQWFIDNYYRYDLYDPKFSKVFMGEYACHTDADGKGKLGGKNTFYSALAESVFMCGMENNPDVVKLSCYAPLFCKVNQANWEPDLIYFDKQRILQTPNYLIQSLFAKNYGTNSIRLDCNRLKDNAGRFSFNAEKDLVKEIAVFNMHGQRLSPKLNRDNLENVIIRISLKTLTGGFSLSLGQNAKEGFGYYLYYNFDNKHIYYEKIVNRTRMTFEDLGKVNLGTDFKVIYTNDCIKLCTGDKDTEVATKKIWKVNTKIFTSLTYDNKNIYLKVINTSRHKEKFVVDFDCLIKHDLSHGSILTITADKNDVLKYRKREKQISFKSSNLKQTLKPNSINLINITL